MKAGGVVLTFGLGVVVGVIGMLWAPQYLDPYVPNMVSGKGRAVEGTVVRKQLEPKRLLLTLSTPQGAILAIFKKKIAEIDLLIDEDDIVTFSLRRYEPFVDDPSIQRVQKEGSSKTSGDVLLPTFPQKDNTLLKPPQSDAGSHGDNQEDSELEP